MLRKAGTDREESAEGDHGASGPDNNCVWGKQFCSTGLFIGMFFLSTPFPHLLPFVLKGSWQIGKGLQAMHRKLWNTMRGRRQIPTHLRKSLVSVVRDPGGDGWSWSHISAPFTERRQCSQRGAEQSKAGSRGRMRGSKTKQDTKTHEISQIAKSSPLPRAPEFYESSFSFPKALFSLLRNSQGTEQRVRKVTPNRVAIRDRRTYC